MSCLLNCSKLGIDSHRLIVIILPVSRGTILVGDQEAQALRAQGAHIIGTKAIAMASLKCPASA
jgi:hypothetical protein